ncbi:hypothetical protein FPOAC2_03830 [Fusarium poae]|uniref:hypothetical protein n=1 Tax=Fusarium poae TaxID=36050 RepID=UPI001CE8C604|nr:hypothetical protein FPOAC1_003770 [Fusarium poae]KAG8677742.1 hypothetical protein FPOAC1_003770 [Fusarium poae]
MSTTWNPTSKEEIEAKKAFEGLGQSLDKVVIPCAESDNDNRFILHSKGYFDLRAYVMSGKDFPTTPADFDAKVSMSAFKKLNELDSDIYNKTRDTMVAVGSSCRDYSYDHLNELVTAGHIAIRYSKYAMDMLDTADGINLRHNLDILLDEKYTSADKFDEVYKVAKEAALMTLTMLSDEATKKQKETDKISETLTAFKADTLKNQPNVKFLVRQYYDGPVVNKSNFKTPYLKYLNEDLARSLRAFEKTVKHADDVHGDWKTNKDWAIGTSFFGLVGFIVMTKYARNAVVLRVTYDNLVKEMEKLEKEQKEERELIKFVNLLVVQCTDIDHKMDDAITAMTELSKLFSNQADCYDGIASYLSSMKSGATRDVLANRKASFHHNIGVCVNKLKELKVVAEEFTDTIHNEIPV